MRPGQWIAFALLVICVSWIAGEFIRIVFLQPPRRTKEQINADVEAMLKAASNEVHDRPRIKAITEPINRRH